MTLWVYLAWYFWVAFYAFILFPECIVHTLWVGLGIEIPYNAQSGAVHMANSPKVNFALTNSYQPLTSLLMIMRFQWDVKKGVDPL